MTTRLLRPERFDLSGWRFANEGPATEKIAENVATELREKLEGEYACDVAFGATVDDSVEAEAADVVVTLPFGLTEDDWEGPLLVISLDDVVQDQIDELDSAKGGAADPDDLAALRDGLAALVNKLDDALARNAGKMSALNRRESPLW